MFKPFIKKVPVLMLFSLYTISGKINAQNIMSIETVTSEVLQKSNKIKIIHNTFSKNSIESDFYRLSILPKVTANFSLPYQRSISEVIQADGSQKFIERNNLNASANLAISQALPFTGGSISISSAINNARDFNNHFSNFSSNWFNIAYQQTINGFNSYKWNKKINSLNQKKDSINYIKEKIKLKYEVAKQYLETQLLQLKGDLLEASIKKTEKIVLELEGKLKYGRVIKTEIKQAEITLLQLKNQQESNNLAYIAAINIIKNMMQHKEQDNFILQAVPTIDFLLDQDNLVATIKKNGFELNKAINELEGASSMDKVKKEGAIAVNLQLGMGVNSAASNFETLYNTPSQSQFITLSTKIPILDWGKSKKNYQLSQLSYQNISLNLQEEEAKIVAQATEIVNYKISLTAQIRTLSEQLKLSQEIDTMYEELLQYNRKTIAEYKAQLIDTYTINIEYQKAINNLYLLKLKIDEYELNL